MRNLLKRSKLIITKLLLLIVGFVPIVMQTENLYSVAKDSFTMKAGLSFFESTFATGDVLFAVAQDSDLASVKNKVERVQNMQGVKCVFYFGTLEKVNVDLQVLDVIFSAFGYTDVINTVDENVNNMFEVEFSGELKCYPIIVFMNEDLGQETISGICTELKNIFGTFYSAFELCKDVALGKNNIATQVFASWNLLILPFGNGTRQKDFLCDLQTQGISEVISVFSCINLCEQDFCVLLDSFYTALPTEYASLMAMDEDGMRYSLCLVKSEPDLQYILDIADFYYESYYVLSPSEAKYLADKGMTSVICMALAVLYLFSAYNFTKNLTSFAKIWY